MTALRSLLGLAILAMTAGGCIPQSASAQTFPEPVEVAGPPGGQMDPQDPRYAQQAPQGQYAQDPQYGPQGDDQGYAPQGDGAQIDVNVDAQGQADPYADPQDPGVAMGDVNDQEIDQTLDGQGTWADVDGYGRVWRPDATLVGADFTPYETGGGWVDTDAGWSFACDDYAWGWLPFHYGRWGWFDGYWGWQPGYQWGSSYVDWRDGGGYVGWRPQGPIDHGGHHPLPQHDSHWRFSKQSDFTKAHIRSHLFNNPAEALRVTQAIATPGLHTGAPVRAAALMRNRLAARQSLGTAHGGTFNREPGRTPGQAFRNTPGSRDREAPTWQYHPQQRPQQPAYRQPSQQPAYRQPSQQPAYRQPQQPAYRQPQQPAYRQPQQPAYRQPSQQSYRQQPAPYRAPSRAPSAPSSTYRSSGGSSHSSSGSSHSSSGSSHSSSSGGHSSGGGHHR